MLDIRDSTTYQAILREGRIVGGQRILIGLGTKTFGKCDSSTLCTTEAIRDFDLLCILCERILDSEVRDWRELLQTA
jgi:hypothetical protein